MEIALHAKLKNGPLFRYRQQHGLSQAAAAEKAGVSPQMWGRIENLRFHYISQRFIDKVACSVGIPPDEICPPELRDKDHNQTATFYRTVEAKVLAGQHADRMCLPDPSRSAEQKELAEKMALVLQTLTYREREIMKLRWGLFGNPCCTLDEITKIFKVNRARVGQIEARALQKLTHPVRLGRLSSCL